MLQDRYETDKVFTEILQLTNEMDPILAQIDQLLEDEALYQLIRNDLAKRYPPGSASILAEEQFLRDNIDELFHRIGKTRILFCLPKHNNHTNRTR